MNTSQKRNNNIEFSLIDLLSNVCGKAIMIISLAIIFGLVSIIFGFLSTPKFNIGLSMQLPTVNISINTPYDFNYFMNIIKSKEMLEKTYREVTGENKSANDINKNMFISTSDGKTLDFNIPKTSQPDLCTELIFSLINNSLEIYKTNNKEYIANEIDSLNEKIEYLESTTTLTEKETIELKKTIIEYNTMLKILNDFNNKLDNEIIYINHLYKDNVPSVFPSLKMFILFAIVGGFIGIIIAIIQILTDRHNYKSTTLINCINNENDFLGAIPVYKQNEKINNNYFRYLLKQIPENYSKVYISSISPNAGVNTITKGLIKSVKEANSPMEIENRISIKENPLNSLQIEKNTMMILVIKAGEDTYDNISIISNDLNRRNVKTGYILNFADPSDRNAISFDSSKETKKIGLFRNYVSFYRNLYKQL